MMLSGLVKVSTSCLSKRNNQAGELLLKLTFQNLLFRKGRQSTRCTEMDRHTKSSIPENGAKTRLPTMWQLNLMGSLARHLLSHHDRKNMPHLNLCKARHRLQSKLLWPKFLLFQHHSPPQHKHLSLLKKKNLPESLDGWRDSSVSSNSKMHQLN